jgi:hypothetical protein
MLSFVSFLRSAASTASFAARAFAGAARCTSASAEKHEKPAPTSPKHADLRPARLPATSTDVTRVED